MNPIDHGNNQPKRPSFNDDVPKPGPEVYVLRMPADRTITFVAWGDKLRGFDVHWLGNRTAMHFEPAEECEHCLKNLPSKWKGYLHVYAVELKQEFFLEFTKITASAFQHQVANPDHLRGCTFRLKRGKSKNSRMSIIILAPVTVETALPPEKDPRPCILRLYGYSDNQIAEWLATGPTPHEEW